MEETSKAEERIFSPAIVNWLLALVVGLILPLLFQDYVANIVSGLSDAPSLINGEVSIPTESSIAVAYLSLGGILLAYVISVVHQIRFMFVLKTYNTVWACILTIVLPFFIWFQLPFLFQLVSS